MRKIFLGIGIILGSMVLWCCGIGLLWLMIMLFESVPLLYSLHFGREIPINIGLAAAILAVLIWRFAAWKRKLGNDISTGLFTFLVILGGVLPLTYVWLFFHSFD